MLRCALNDLVQRLRWRFQDADRLYHEGINAESRASRRDPLLAFVVFGLRLA